MNKAQIETRISAALDYLLNQFTGLDFRQCDWAEAFASTDVISYEEGYSYYSDQMPNQIEGYTEQCIEQHELSEWATLIAYADGPAKDRILFG